MKNKLTLLFQFILLVMGIFICLAAAAGYYAVDQIPRQAAEKFGPAGPGLNLQQRVAYSFRLLANEKSLLTPLDLEGSPHQFSVSIGETVNSIATRLEEERLISNADAFRTYLIYAGLDKGVQAGNYQLSPTMSPVQIARSLQDAAPEEVTFNILPGMRAEEVAALLPTSGLKITQEQFLQIVRNPPDDIFPTGFPNVASLEGYLMPGPYQIKRDISARGLVSIFLERFDQAVTEDLRSGFDQQGLDLGQALTLASIVQREAMKTDEQPTIASVFYNRLAQGMKLDSDPTVQYAVGYDLEKKSWWKNPLSQADLQTDSRYNTYIYPGLPPGPIANPGIDALQAVANPAQTGFYFFRAKCDGSGRHAFSVTYEEHLQNACP